MKDEENSEGTEEEEDGEEDAKEMEYGCGIGLVIGCLLFLPLVMGPMAPSSLPVQIHHMCVFEVDVFPIQMKRF